MKRDFDVGHVALIQGDITGLPVDIIVTAANTALRGGGGVDGAVHRAAGPELLAACRKIGGCPAGDAVRTDAFLLSEKDVRFIVHAVGPKWAGGDMGEDGLLRGSYRRSLELAEESGCGSIAFPSISTGVYAFPVERAAPIAVETVRDFLAGKPAHVRRVVFALFDVPTLEVFSKALQAA